MLPSEFRAEVLAFIQASGGSCTVADILAACELDQRRCGVSCVRWKLYQLLNDLEAEGTIISWMEPGVGIGTKHWRLS